MKNIRLLISITLLLLTTTASASKLVTVSIVDKDYIMLYFRDGDVTFNERAISGWPLYYNGEFSSSINSLTSYGSNLNTANVATANNWKITSTDDSNFGTGGVSPSNVYRKSKLGCMAQMAWNSSSNDYNYDWAYEHTIFLKLPKSMASGKTYTIQLPTNINSDVTTKAITFDIFTNRSEAVKVNIVGYSTANSIKSADVYLWMGNGGARDYSSFVGKKIYIYNTDTKVSQQVGTLSLWGAAATETGVGHQMLQTNVWMADFTGFNTAGNYCLAIEDIGCSDDFKINPNIYYEPFKVSTQGFYYMRIGENGVASGISPVARQPLYIPGSSPSGCKVIITTVHPYSGANWDNLSGGDKWDESGDKATETASNWNKYSTGRTNPNAYGGHSDAMDWDRHLGHVSIIYDMLLPYYLSQGKLSDDNMGIKESGNSIPDILDEARNEVDFWLRLRDGKGYSHGLTNPTTSTTAPVLFQAGNTGVAAWANAANAAMLADCFRLSGHTSLMTAYRDSAVNAYNYAKSLSTTDQMLTQNQEVGDATMTGNDFKITAAAFLYNLTGNTTYENDLLSGSRCTSNTSQVFNSSSCEIYAVAGYLFTNRTVNNQTRYNNMKNSIIAEAKTKEANYTVFGNTNRRPSRRSTNEDAGWFITSIHNQRTIIAHAISDAGSADKKLFEDALILEADFSLGRNPLNMINMTTATTGLANKKSVENAYTSGWNDGTTGVHPGHTPYMNAYDWGGLIMGRPKWMADKNYPAVVYNGNNVAKDSWPIGELYYNTRYVYAANEFTPQQTMRGKTALYGYLYAIRPVSCTQYTVTFNSDGGSAVTAQTDCSGFTATEPAAPTKSGYTFAGWYNGATLFNFATVVTANITLTAHWTQIPSTNTVIADCETAQTNVCTQWWDYDDGLGSTITCPKEANGAISITQGGAAAGTGYISVSFNTAAQGAWPNANYDIWGVGFGFDLNPASTVNLTGATGISFYHKGAAGAVQIATSQYPESFSADIEAHTNWTLVTVPFSDMKIGYGTNQNTILTNLSSVKAVQFQIPAGAQAKTNTFSIDQVQINTIALALTPCATPCTEYTVTFDSNGGSAVPSQEVCSGEKAVKPATNPTRTGYTFNNWYTALTGGSVFNFTTASITANTTIYARWTANTNTVTFDRQSGTNGSTSVTATYGSAMPTATAPTRTGYAFGGYYTAANGGGTQYYTATMTSAKTWDLTVNTTLYASWTASTYAVTLDRQNGSGGTASVTATYNAAMPSGAQAPARTGYTFGGYYSATTGGTQYYTATMTSAKTWDLTVATTLYARWTANTNVVTLDRQNGSGGTASVKATYNAAMPSGAQAPTRTGYTFGGYYSATTGGTQYYTATMTSAKTWDLTVATTLYARWTANTNVVTFDRQSGTNGSTSVTATYGSAMPTATAPTRTGYTFGGYYTAANGAGTQYYTATMTSARTWDLTVATTLYAKWTASAYNVTLNRQSGTGGTASVTPTYDAAMPAAQPPTRTGYAFGGYYTAANGAGTQYYTATMTSAKNWDLTVATTLYASWTANTYTVTLEGESITVTYNAPMPAANAPAKTGYTFGGYYTGANGTGTQYYTATMGSARNWNLTEATTLYAKWTAISYPITYMLDGGENASGNPLTYTIEDHIILQNPAKEKHEFIGWKEGNEIPLGSTGEKTFTATWDFRDNLPNTSSSIAGIQIYPNPAKGGLFNVALPNSETAVLTIVNLQGQAIYNTVINNGFASINSGLEAGVYIVSIQSESGLTTQKLIVK